MSGSLFWDTVYCSSVVLDWFTDVVTVFCSFELTLFSRFGDTVQNVFYLNDYQVKSQLTSAINRIGYDPLGSGRNVEAALNTMRTQQFTESRVRWVVALKQKK